MLRGEKGSEVEVEVFRKLTGEVFKTRITRDDIPIYSVDVHYMIDDTTGYIKVNRFAETTYLEFRKSLKALIDLGMSKLVIDLRDNPGGYLHTANEMVDDLLEKDALIVYTEGRNREREYHFAKNGGLFESGELVILINEGSASASEIIAGAVQDNDRGLIVGRRSFGKGLVQEQWTLKDGSAIRLTVARYFTPSGRCIQKSYDNGYEDYYMESYHRWDNGEMWSIDSTEIADSLKYTTVNGRTVYGGGGITPDLFVPIDTLGRTGKYYRLVNRAYLNNWAFDFADRNRTALNEMSFQEFKDASDPLGINAFLSGVLQQEDISDLGDKGDILVQFRFKALVASYIWGDAGFYPIIHEIDDVVSVATK
jgi:carboxyl-terminal processing protease